MDELQISVPKWQLSVSKSSGIEISVDEISMPEISMPGDEMLHGASRRKFASFPNGFPSNGGPTDLVLRDAISLCFPMLFHRIEFSRSVFCSILDRVAKSVRYRNAPEDESSVPNGFHSVSKFIPGRAEEVKSKQFGGICNFR